MNDLKPPAGWNAYLVTFKTQDRDPQTKTAMYGYAVRIFAPSDEAAKKVVTHRFGTAFYQLHDEKKTKAFKLVSYPKGIFETLLFKKDKHVNKLK